MKNVILLLALFLFCGNSYCQKKKVSQKSASSSSVIAKADNLAAELIKNNLYLFVNNKGAKKDTIFTKTIDPKIALSECKIIAFKAKGTPLYYITWVEKNTTKTDLKTEEATTVVSEIWEISPGAKAQILANKQTNTKVIEIVFLDKLKNASETQEKMRREGYEFTLTKEGDVILKNKAMENKMSYNATNKKYVGASSAPPAKKK